MLIVQPLPEAYEILVTFKLSAGHAGPYTATPQGAVLLPMPQGGLGLYLDPDVLEGLEFPGSNRPGKQQRVDERIARAQRLEQLPPGDTGLGGAQ